MQSFLELDGNILLWIQQNVRQPWLTPIMKAVTALGDFGLIWIILTIILLIRRSSRGIGAQCALSLIFSSIIVNLVLKLIVARTRPYEVVPGLTLLVQRAWDYSFPSGHAAASFSAAWIIFRKAPRKYGIPALVLAALISFSRLYVGIHYPTDVVCGILVGLFCAWMTMKIWPMLCSRVQRRGERGSGKQAPEKHS